MWFLLLIPLSFRVASEEPVVTDRPDFTESSFVVPISRTQLEMGLTYETADDRSISGPETLIRFGVAENWELRFGVPDYNDVRAGGATTTGWGDLNLGAKYQIGKLGEFDSAVIFGASLPTGSRDFRSDTVDPEVKFCISRDLSPTLGLSAMVAAAWPTLGNRRETAWQTTLSLGFATSEKGGFFTEYAGNFMAGLEPDHILHAGLVFQPNSDSQWDVHFGFNPVGREKRVFVGAGYSVRL